VRLSIQIIKNLIRKFDQQEFPVGFFMLAGWTEWIWICIHYLSGAWNLTISLGNPDPAKVKTNLGKLKATTF
jgi:hypothetical protein